MLKTATAHGQTLRVFGKLTAGISLAVCLTGCSQAKQTESQQAAKAWTDKQVANTKSKTISDWTNKPGKRTRVIVYSTIPDVAGVAATANMKSGYVNRVYKYKSPAILDNYYFSYVSSSSIKTKTIKYVVFKSAKIDGIKVSKDKGSFNNAVVYVSKSAIDKENALANKAFKKTSKKHSKAYNKDLEAYSKYRDDLYNKMLQALGTAAGKAAVK